MLMRFIGLFGNSGRCASVKAEDARLIPNPHRSLAFILLFRHEAGPIQITEKVYYATPIVENLLKRGIGK